MIKRPAIVSLSTVIALGVVSLLIVLFSVLAGIDLIEQSHRSIETQETFAGGEGCVNEGLLELSGNVSYTGGNITIGSVDCVISVTGSGGSRTISVTATQGTQYTQSIEVDLDVSVRPFIITNWEEL